MEQADIERVTREICILKVLRHPNIIQLYEVPPPHADNIDQDRHPPHHGVCRGRRTLRLHRQAQAAGGEGSCGLHAPDNLGGVVHPQERHRAPRPQALEPAARPQQEHQNRGLRPLQPVQTRRETQDRMRQSLLRLALDDRRQALRVPGHRPMVLRDHPLRHALRVPALLGPQHQQTLQEDHGRRIRCPQNPVAREQGPAQRHSEHEP